LDIAKLRHYQGIEGSYTKDTKPTEVPSTQASIKRSGAEKLEPRFFGPYRVSRRIGVVAYEMELP
jgi:hypothetical protein